MKKILLILIFLIFLINFISAWEWDNVKSYDEQTKTATITNALGLGETIAEVKLISPKINYVIRGEDRLVAEFEINNFDDYTNVFNNLEFYNKKGMEKFEREFTYKYEVVTGTEEIPITERTCTPYDDKGNLTEICENKIIDYETREIKEWRVLDKELGLQKGIIRIGIFTDVKANDKVEWIPTLFGVEIEEWATWLESFNIGLNHYWNFDETSGTNAEDVRGGDTGVSQANATLTGTSISFETGKIGNAINLTKVASSYANITDNANLNGIFNGTTPFTISFWMSTPMTTRTAKGFFGWGKNTPNGFFDIGWDMTGGFPNTVGITFEGNGGNNRKRALSSTEITDNNFHHIVYIFYAKDFSNSVHSLFNIYIDGVNQTLNDQTAGEPTTPILNAGFGSRFGQDSITWDSTNYQHEGKIDEFGIWNRTLTSDEITQLYNGGTGITYVGDFTVSPTVTLNSPENYYNSSSQTININCSAVDDSIIENVSLYINGALNYTETDGVDNFTEIYQSLNFADGTYEWTCNAVDDENNMGWATSNFTFTVDTTSPVLSNLYNLTNLTTFSLPVNSTWNYTATDANLASCYYNTSDDITFKFLACNSASIGTNWSVGGSKTVYYCANDTVGLETCDSEDIFINSVVTNVTFNSSVIEGDNSTIGFNLGATSINSISANLTYNGTVYNMSEISNNGTYASFLVNATAPFIDADTYVNFTINFSLNGDLFGSSIYNQTIYNIQALNVSLFPCSDLAFNFTMKDEQNFSILNGTLEYNFEYGTQTNNNISKAFGQVTAASSLYVCLNSSIVQNWTLGSGEIFYRSNGYVDRRYYLFEGMVINNETSNITLYDLETTDQTSFKLEIEDTSLNPYIEKYSALLRWYPNFDEYRIVEMGQTDEKGDTVIHVEAEDVDYRIAVYERNGSLIKMEDPTRFVCLVDPCTYTLRISPTDTDFTSLLNIDYTFTYNTTTSMWNFIYSDTSQKTTGMNLTVWKVTGTSVYPICSDYSSDYSGVLTCNTSLYSGSLKGIVSRSSSPAVPFVQKVINTASTAFSSTFGLWLSLIIGIPIVFIFAIMSPVAAVIGGVVALIPAFYFGAINWAVLGGIAILGGIVMHFLKRIG